MEPNNQTPASLPTPEPATPATEPGVLLRQDISGLTTLFSAEHARAILAYPGTVWHLAEEAVEAEIHAIAEDIATATAPESAQQEAQEDAPAPVLTPEPVAAPEPTPEPAPTTPAAAADQPQTFPGMAT